jgi:hypothetical protein
MNEAVRRFRQGATRENRGQRRIRRRYSVALQREAVRYCESQGATGVGVREVAAALGVAVESASVDAPTPVEASGIPTRRGGLDLPR